MLEIDTYMLDSYTSIHLLFHTTHLTEALHDI